MKTKYYIYHIPGVKIGVSNNPEHRVIKQQGFSEYEILEEHTNAKVVSKREIELQKQYGYKVDKIEYWKTLKWQKKQASPEARKKAVNNRKVSYKETAKTIDWEPIRIKAVANTDYSKIDYETRTINFNYFERNNHPNFINSRGKGSEKRKKPINQYDLKGNFIKQWDSATDAAKELKLNKQAINNCCREKLKTAHKFIWKYAN